MTFQAAIDTIQSRGYRLRKYDNYQMGKIVEACPVAYEIMHADCATVYGFGRCSEEQVIGFAELALKYNKTEIPETTEPHEAEPETPEARKAREEKAREYDRIHNEGGEGYNPYRR